MSILDQIVKVEISAPGPAVATTAFTIPLVIATIGTKPVSFGSAATKRYSDADAVADDFGNDSQVYAICRDLFGQDRRPEYCIVVPWVSPATLPNTLAAAVAEDNSFYCILGDLTTYADVAAVGTFCDANDRISLFDSNSADILSAVADDDIVSLLADAGHGRAGICYHVDPTGAAARNDSLSGALAGLKLGKDPALGTWAHKRLNSVSPDNLSSLDFQAATDKKANVYVRTAGVNRTAFGTFADGTFIDSVCKRDWVKARMQERIFGLLGEANDGEGVDYDDNGIQAVAAVITGTLAEAFARKYIMEDYSVITPEFVQIPAQDRAARNLPLVKFRFSILDSIHTAKPIEGAVVP